MISWWTMADAIHWLATLILWPVRWSLWGGARVRFEEQLDARTFTADWTFEISSEGEYEQVRPWISTLLREGSKVEMIFASESVERAMTKLQSTYPQQVKLLRLPLLTNKFGALERRLTGRHFVMCRYDFFPLLMRHAGRADIDAGLVWASFKGRRQRLNSRAWRWWYRQFFSVFDWIIPATIEDEQLFKLIHPRVLPAVDFRVGQIQARVTDRARTLAQRFPHWDEFRRVLERFPPERRLVLGSVWESDLGILQSAPLRQRILAGELLVLVVPHKLSDEWVRALESLDFTVNHVSEGRMFPHEVAAGPWLINLKGVLCELYAEAKLVYVGGGFERSIHSVLEPFVAGAQIWCGPKLHRSTEAELIQSVAGEVFHSSADPVQIGNELAAATADNAQRPDQRGQWQDNQTQQAHHVIQELKD